MEVATTATANTHNHSHHSHHRSDHFPLPEEQHIPAHRAHNGFGVGLISNGTGSGGAHSPFQREVREWQRIDPDTGALLTGRVEADRWINGPMNSYGKISDSQNISQPNGTQHTQRKQLEVLQARTASGAMQVIRAQTVQTTSSRWSSSASTSASTSTSSSAIASPIITGSSAINGNNHIHSKNNTNLESSSLLIPSLLSRMSTLNRTQSCDSTSSSDVESKNLTQNFPLNNGLNNIGSNKLSTHVTTAPSQKLSNLMKSNSSLSNNNNNNNNSKNSTTMNNTHHKNSAADKISLHAIVGGGENVRRITSSPSPTPSPSLSSLTTMKSTSNWQQQQRSSQLFEQPTLFGNDNQCQSLSKSRVGVNAAKSSSGCTAGDGVTTIAAVVINEGGDGDSTTPTQLKSRQQKQDLESFRHHNERQSSSTSTATSTVNVVSALDDDDEIDDALRLSKRHQRRQQIPQHDTEMRLQRSRSISTDDLTSELEKHTDSDNEDAGEWRRVSKLRRSFQSSSSNSKKESSTQPRRPIDLPTNSVSVARIRAELENGRRLNTAMRNNCVDLAALDTILNGNGESPKPVTSKRSSFLTAESLKEIRAGLKKLSDESLYRDDYVPTVHNAAPDEHIQIQDIKKPPERIRTRQLLAEKLTEITPPKSAFQVFTRPLALLDSPTNSYLTQRSLPIGSSQKHTTHSLESRQKTRESAASIDWHLRRKSYGFEKMSPPDDKTIFNKDASIDSGLGRSGEQLGNWSPIESGTPTTRATVIHFGETPKVVANPSNLTVVKRFRHLKSPESVDADSEVKRHSIAVDESQYVRENVRKTSQVHLNGYYDGTTEPETSTSRLLVSSEATISSNGLFRHANQQKRVEFCKTEVHFAAESGRVNIVETDGKPPPTNNFRRRRRTTSGPLQTIVKSASTINDPLPNSSNSVNRPVTHFGDTHQSPMLQNNTIARRSSSQEPLPAVDFEMSSVTFTMPKALENPSTLFSSSRTCYASTGGVETTDGETDEMSAIRGILKNKPAKPKPYHLGENVENADALWGVQLRPVGETVNHEGPKNASPPLISSASVAERVRIVEQRQDTASTSQSNGFSTKINLSLVDDPKVWPDTGTSLVTDIDLNNAKKSINQKRPSLQEIMLQDLRDHQRILDQGLKSTALIIKTMRSANEFDEAMRRLSIASTESTLIPPIIIPTPMIRSHNYQQGTLRHTFSTSESDSKTDIIKATPFASPRLKLLENTELSVNQQLIQLRCMYDLEASNATSQDEDSADEEVKRYFNGHHEEDSSDSRDDSIQENSSLEDEYSVEYSNSWSRLKAKRTIWHIGSCESDKQTAELPKSNVMSIELHSPHTSLDSSDANLVQTTLPVAKPRTFMSTKNTEETHSKAISKEAREKAVNKEANNDFLKIVKETRGARKLREHELSYFGVPAPKDGEIEIKPSFPSSQGKSLKRNLPTQRKTNEEHHKSSPKTESMSDTTKQQVITKWQLLNDKPDLLRHSPIAIQPQSIATTTKIRPVERKSLKNPSDCNNENDDHIYENVAIDIKPIFRVKSPSKADEKHYEEQSHYNRKMDLKRDAIILNEMTENADQSLKALSDEAAIKDQRRRSLHRRNSKPLETIDEKTIPERINDKCIAVKITRSTLASEAKRVTSRHISPSPTKQSSRTRSSSQSSNENENVKIRPKRSPTSLMRSRNPRSESRSSSHESQNSAAHCCSSGDDEPIKRADLLRVKKSKVISTGDTRRHSNKDPLHQRDKVQTSAGPLEKLLRRGDDHKKRPSSSTAHSSRRERVEYNDEVKTHHSRHHYDKKQHHPLMESTGCRKHKDQKSTCSSTKNLEEKRERDKSRSSTKGNDHRHHASPINRDVEREKSSRSKGHSSRSSELKNERIDGVIHEKHRDSPTKLREHKKSTINSKQRNPAAPTTHRKIAPIISEQNQYQHAPHQNGNHENHHLHSMTTATIAAKHTHCTGKDRK